MLNHLWICFLFACSLCAQPVVELTEWPDDRRAALSLRLSDCLPSHLHEAAPLLQQHHLPATFMITRNSWWYVRDEDRWIALLQNPDFEFGNQTMNQSGLRSLEDARYEIGECARYLRKVTGSNQPLYFYNMEKATMNPEITPEAMAAILREFNLFEKEDRTVLLPSLLENPGLDAYLQSVVQTGGWHIIAVYGVGPNGFYKNVSRESFRQLCEKLAALRQTDLWLAPLAQVHAYQTTRRQAVLSDLRSTAREIGFALVLPADSLSSPSILTVRVDLPAKRQFDPAASSGILAHRQTDSRLYLQIRPSPERVRIALR